MSPETSVRHSFLPCFPDPAVTRPSPDRTCPTSSERPLDRPHLGENVEIHDLLHGRKGLTFADQEDLGVAEVDQPHLQLHDVVRAPPVENLQNKSQSVQDDDFLRSQQGLDRDLLGVVQYRLTVDVVEHVQLPPEGPELRHVQKVVHHDHVHLPPVGERGQVGDEFLLEVGDFGGFLDSNQVVGRVELEVPAVGLAPKVEQVT